MDVQQCANDGLRADFLVVVFDNTLNETFHVSVIFDFASQTLYSLPNGNARVKHVDFVLDSPDVFSDLREEAYFTRDEIRDGVPFKKDVGPN